MNYNYFLPRSIESLYSYPPRTYLFIYSGDGTNTEIIKFEVYSFSG